VKNNDRLLKKTQVSQPQPPSPGAKKKIEKNAALQAE
jgi:hypothetical protein